MKKIRIGNTIDILWGIYIGDGISEQPYDLTGRDLTMFLKDGFGKAIRIADFTTEGHIIKWRYEGKDQQKTGTYSFVLVENDAQDNMYTVDEANAFQLVASSGQAGCACDYNDNIRVTTLEFRSKMAVGNFGGGGVSITVDDELSMTSTNPVQNKVVTKAINQLQETVDGFDAGVKSALSTANAAQVEVGLVKEQVENLNDKVDNIINNILYPTVNPTFTAPSASLSLRNYAAVQEVGTAAPTANNFNTSFNAGAINLSGEKQDNRAGELDEDNSFIYYGGNAANRDLPTEVAEGNTSYKYRAAYAEGPQPLDNKGNAYSKPLAAGHVDSTAVTVNGTWPWYASTASATADSPVVKQPLVAWSVVEMSTEQFTVQPSGSLPQVFKLPRQLKTLQMLNVVSGKMDTIGTSDYAESTETINGREYYVYTYTGSTRGSVTLLAKF